MSFIKDPDAVLDYSWSWADWVNDTETISSATVAADDGITSADLTHDDTVVTVWLSGGTVGEAYRLTCHIVTSEGREDDRSISVRVRQR